MITRSISLIISSEQVDCVKLNSSNYNPLKAFTVERFRLGKPKSTVKGERSVGRINDVNQVVKCSKMAESLRGPLPAVMDLLLFSDYHWQALYFGLDTLVTKFVE